MSKKLNTQRVQSLLIAASSLLVASTGWAQAGAAAAAPAAPGAAPNTAPGGPAVFPTDVENIALAKNGGRVIAVTSTLDNDPAFNANNLIDGQVTSAARPKSSSGWASNRFDPIDMETVTLGFKGDVTRRIGKVVLNPSSNVTPERWAKDVEIQVSTEGPDGPYRPVIFATMRKAAVPQEFKFVPAEAKYLRLVFRSNWGSDRAVALGEVEVYEAIGQSDPIGQIIYQLEGAVSELSRFRQTQFNTGGAPTTVASAQGLSQATLQLIQNIGGTAGAAAARSGARLPNGAPNAALNIAALANGGRIADFSSQFVSDPAKGPDPDYAPEKLLDGQVMKVDAAGNATGTFGWSSQGFTPGKQFVTIGFQDDRTKLLSKIVLNPASNQSQLRWARRVDVQVTTESAKAGPFRTVATINLRSEPVNQEFAIGPVEAKYVRLVFEANGPGDVPIANADPDVNSDRAVSLGEVEIYEATAGSQELDTLIDRFNNVLTQLKNLRNNGKAPAANAATATRPDELKTQRS